MPVIEGPDAALDGGQPLEDVVRVRAFNHTGAGQADAFVVSSFARQVVAIRAGRQAPIMRVGNLESVRDFLRNDLRGRLKGRDAFLSLVASNSLDIVLRELTLGPAHVAAERLRLLALVDGEAGESIDGLRRRLSTGLRDGSIPLERPGLADHLRATVVNQLAIDQPRYSGLAAALAAKGANEG